MYKAYTDSWFLQVVRWGHWTLTTFCTMSVVSCI